MASSHKILFVTVKPLSSKSELIQKNRELKAYLKSPPIDGKANEELIYLVSKQFNVKKTDVKIISGKTSKKKLIRILT